MLYTKEYKLFKNAIIDNDIKTVTDYLNVMDKKVFLGERGGVSPLHIAVLNGRTKIVELLLQAAKKVNMLRQVLTAKGIHRYTPLQYAIWGKIEFSYIFHGTDRDYLEIENETPNIIDAILNIAKENNLLELVLKQQTNLGSNPLSDAARIGKTNAIKKILKSMSEDKEIVKNVLTQKNDFGHTVLHEMGRGCNAKDTKDILEVAEKSGMLEEALLIQDNEERTPLHKAAYWNNPESSIVILQAAKSLGKLVEVLTKQAQYYITPLNDAVMFNNKETDELLTAVSKEVGLTAKDYAKFEEYKGPIKHTTKAELKRLYGKKEKICTGCHTKHILDYL